MDRIAYLSKMVAAYVEAALWTDEPDEPRNDGPLPPPDKPRAMYAIRNVNDHSLAWSNEFGWVTDDSYDLFTQEEHDTLNLPVEGQWWRIE